jgi:hypothetical protein
LPGRRDDAPADADGRPGYARPSNDQIAARRASRSEMIDASRDAWRSADARKKPPPDDPDEDDDDDDRTDPRDARASATAEYRRMCSRLTDAWRSPPARDFAEPDQGTRPEDLALMRRRPLPHDDPAAALRSHLSAGPGSDRPDEVAARKARAYQDYTTELANAWRNPPGVRSPQRSLAGPGPSALIKAASSGDPTERAEEIEKLGERWRGGK